MLPKHLALPIFASDPLSSVAYAPQELLLILALGGTSVMHFAPWIAGSIILLLVIVVLSYRQLIRAYPGGGGDYEVAHRNLGEKAGLVVASALLIDYILTVTVSVASGVDNLISAFPVLAGIRVEMAVGFVVLLLAVNLRGVRESSTAFAIPTYFFIASVLLMIVVGLIRTSLGDAPVAVSAQYSLNVSGDFTQAGLALLLLRAFSSGCSALTGVEAIANGVPAFRRPKYRNAQKTLTIMGAIAITLFAGVTSLALISGVKYVENPCDLAGWARCGQDPQQSVMAQLASAIFGGNTSILFFAVQAGTAAVLLLAANTAFNGFPLLGSTLARDQYAPKAMLTRGDRLVFSNGLFILSAAAIVILIATQANLTVLIQMYIIGVFISFTLGQIGMVRHWMSLRAKIGWNPAIRRGFLINGAGATSTAAALVIVTVTKFTHGAWVVFAIMPILFLLMLAVNRYYRAVEDEIEADNTIFGSLGDHAIVLIGHMQKPVLKAVDYALAADHPSFEAVHVSTDPEATKRLQKQWQQRCAGIPLTVLQSPYRDIAVPIIQYLKQHKKEHGSEVITIYMPQFVVGHWWENILHNHRSIRIRRQLMAVHGVMIALVPWQLHSSEALLTRVPRPRPGQERAGVPIRER